MKNDSEQVTKVRPVLLHQLRTIREARSLTQAGLAKQLGVPRAAIERLEAGGPARVWEVPLLAAALAVDPKELIGLPES